MKIANLAAAVLFPCLLAPAPLAGQTSDDVDKYIAAEMQARRIPGLGVAVVRDGSIVRTGYYGLANVEVEAPVNERSVFAIASLDKELTAAGIMRLVQSGRVSLDDPLEKHLEGPWGTICIRHLLTHTSGLPDEVAARIEDRSFATYTTEQLLETVRQLTPVAPPGERFLYSDANFFLSQLVTERASGEPWRQFVSREIFEPAGMRSATYMDPLRIRPGRVSPYNLDPSGGLVRDPSREIDFGPLYNDLGMTVRDFASWLVALGTDRPLSPAVREAMWTPAPLANGSPVNMVGQWRNYGFGFGLDQIHGHRVVTHSGFVGVGFVMFPEDRVSVVVFTNLRHGAGSDPVGLAYGVAGNYLPDIVLRTRTATPDPDAALASALRAEYERMLEGTVGDRTWAPQTRTTAWEGAGDLAVRKKRFGSLLGFDYLGTDRQTAPHRLLWYRARHANAMIFLRFELDAAGRITNLQWYHV
jgi:CubicO group peptidase (beta-lactamase class C family)